VCIVSANPKAYHAALKAGRRAARWVQAHYPGLGLWDGDELQAEARLQYVRAVARWDGRGSLCGWVAFFVHKRLLHKIHGELGGGRAAPRFRTFRTEALDGGRFVRPKGPDLAARVAELSDAARVVAGLVFEQVRPHGAGKRVRAVVQKKLRQRGWTAAKTARAFQELSEAV